MQVHSESRRQFANNNCPTSVDNSLLNEEMAKMNHGQTLERLNERGGMGIREMVANIKHERIGHDDTLIDLEELKVLINNHDKIINL